jgi:hyperosmotically inducible periplasmic protein
MKTIRRLKMVSALLLLGVLLQAQAQSPGAEAASASPAGVKSQYEASSCRAARAANSALARRVRNAVVRDGTIDAVQLYVMACDGVIFLMGAVPQMSQAERAEKIAKGIPGVKSVKNVLTLRMEA